MSNTTKHPYAEILKAIADGKTIEFQGFSTGNWVVNAASMTLREIADSEYSPSRYRIKLDQIQINGIDVPHPLRELPEQGTVFWPSFGPNAGEDQTEGCDVGYYQTMLPILIQQGLLHDTREAASAHAKAIISITAQKAS